jgi:hypothetical protein
MLQVPNFHDRTAAERKRRQRSRISIDFHREVGKRGRPGNLQQVEVEFVKEKLGEAHEKGEFPKLSCVLDIV